MGCASMPATTVDARSAAARRAWTFPVGVHRALRWLTQRAGRGPGVWRLRRRLLDLERVRFSQGMVQTRLAYGQSLWVYPNDLIGRYVFYAGLWEGPIARHFYEHLRPGERVLDIGGNIGQYTVLAASKVGPTGRVFAVEPGEKVRDLLTRSVRANGLEN